MSSTTGSSAVIRAILLVGAVLSLSSAALAETTPQLVADLATPAPYGSSHPSGAFTLAGLTYFTADDGRHGRELWRTDGTTAGTALVADLCPGSCSFGSNGSGYGVLDERIFALGNDGAGLALFAIDEAGAAPRLVTRFAGAWPPLSTRPVAFAGEIWFNVAAPARGRWHYQLWRSDGTREGTRPADSPACGGSCPFAPTVLGVAGDALYFQAGDESRLWRARQRAGGVELADVCGDPCPRLAQAVVAGERLFFSGTDDPHGTEMWTIGPGESSARLLADLVRGSAGSHPVFLAASGDFVYFSPNDRFPRIWYRSNGGPLERVNGLEPYADGIGTYEPIPAGQRLYFLVSHQGTELWALGPGSQPARRLLYGFSDISYLGTLDGRDRFAISFANEARFWSTDGSVGGSRFDGSLGSQFLVRMPGSQPIGGSLLVAGSDPTSGIEPWLTDGTPAGTRRLADLNLADASEPGPLQALGGELFFNVAAKQRLYRAGGSPPMAVPTQVGETRELVVAGGKLFAALSGLGPLVAIDPQGESQPITEQWAHHPTPWGDRVAFGGATDGGARGQGIWLTDGTPAGTRLLFDVRPGWFPLCPFECSPADAPYPRGLTAVGSWLFFIGLPAGDFAGGPWAEQLYRIDAGGSAVALLPPPPPERYRELEAPIALGSGVVFVVRTTSGNNLSSSELWVSGGTPETTRPVLAVEGIEPRLLGVVGGRALFARHPEDGGADELWSSDGTVAGTTLLHALGGPTAAARVTTGSTTPPLRPWERKERSVVGGERLYFAVADADAGEELWMSDGTAAGTRRTGDVYPGAAGSHPTSLAAYRSCALFAASDGVRGHEMWASDGASDFLVADVAPGSAASSPGPPTAAGGTLYFAADDGAHGRELFAVSTAELDVRCAAPGVPGPLPPPGPDPPPPPPPPPGPSDPPPPAGDWLTSNAFPGFRVKVQFGAGASTRMGTAAPCATGTLCVVERPGDQRELLLRLVPSTGRLTPAIAKLTPAEAQVWVEQVATGVRRYYRLAETSPGDDTLHGRLDRSGFGDATAAAPTLAPRKGGGQWLQPRGMPGYRFKVRWTTPNGISQAARATDCMSGALCLATSVRGRADVVVRLLDQGPLGRWPAIARLAPLGVEVIVEEVKTHRQQRYVLPPLQATSEELDGVLDRNFP